MNANALTWTWLGATLCFAVLALAPMAAQAEHKPGWQAGGDGVPESVDLKDVAAASGVVVAVGRDGLTGEAAIYRHAGGEWHEDSIDGLTDEARLEAVAITSSVAWAVGASGSGEDEGPLVVRLADLTAGPAAWEQLTTPEGFTSPTSVALHGSAGLIGTANGGIYEIADEAITSLGTVDAPVNGVAMYSPTEGYAVTDRGEASIYRVDTADPVLPLPLLSDPIRPVQETGGTDENVVAVAATSASQAIAIDDGGGIWQPGTGGATGGATWERSTFGDPGDGPVSLHDVSRIVPEGESAVTAISGENGDGGAAWRRIGSGPWELIRADLDSSAAALTTVAALGEEDIWAVNGEGALLHFAPKPHVPTAKILDGPTGTIAEPTPTFKFEATDDENATFECQLTGGTWFGCESPYTTSPLADGTHTFEVRAINARGTGLPASLTFTVKRPSDDPPSQDDGNNGSTPQDGSGGGSPQGGGGGGSTQDPPPPPPPPSAWFVAGPTGTIAGPTATFTFTTDQGGVSFECRRNGEIWFACASPHTTAELPRGEHVFDVRATNANGTGPPASRAFTVVPRSGDQSGNGQATNCPRAAAGQRLLRGIRVAPRLRGKRKQVVVRFRARARARVRVIAQRQGKIVGRTKMRTVKKGKRQMRVRVSQKPNRVRVIARLPKNCPQNRARAAGASR